MAGLDVEKLLAPVSDGSPCGENLEYNPAYMELDRLAQGTPEQTMGSTTIPAVEPNWKELRERCQELLGQTRRSEERRVGKECRARGWADDDRIEKGVM